MPAPELDPLLSDYLKHESDVRSLLGVDPATITGGAAHAALSAMLGTLQSALRERDDAVRSLQEALDDLRELDRPAAPPEPTEAPIARCYSISDPIQYLDLGRARESRVRCQLPPGHDGRHAGTLGDGRLTRWN